jgi:hypothetical protein
MQPKKIDVSDVAFPDVGQVSGKSFIPEPDEAIYLIGLKHIQDQDPELFSKLSRWKGLKYLEASAAAGNQNNQVVLQCWHAAGLSEAFCKQEVENGLKHFLETSSLVLSELFA